MGVWGLSKRAIKAREIKEIFSAEDVLRIFPRLATEHMPRRVRKGIVGRSIFTDRRKRVAKDPGRNKLLHQLRVPHKKFKFSSDIAIYDNKISMASLKGNLNGVVIEDRNIAQTLRSTFALAWRAAKKYKKNQPGTNRLT